MSPACFFCFNVSGLSVITINGMEQSLPDVIETVSSFVLPLKDDDTAFIDGVELSKRDANVFLARLREAMRWRGENRRKWLLGASYYISPEAIASRKRSVETNWNLPTE